MNAGTELQPVITETFPKLSAFWKSVQNSFNENNTSFTGDFKKLNSDEMKLLHHPFAVNNGMSEVQVEGSGVVTADIQPNLNHINAYDSVHGGWTATMSDSAMAAAAQTLAQPGKVAVSAEIALQKYQTEIIPGEKYKVTAKVLNPDHPNPTVISVVKNQNGEIVSSSSGKFTYVKKGVA